MKTREILVDRLTDPESATRLLVADSSEKALILDSIRTTIRLFKDHLQNFSDSESSISLSKEFSWGEERVVVRGGKPKQSFLAKLKALFQL